VRFKISRLSEKDAIEFMKLQDGFAREHLDMAKRHYKNMKLQDWRAVLLCPQKILDQKGGREHHVLDMTKKISDCFKNLHILKAEEAPELAARSSILGFLMVQVRDLEEEGQLLAFDDMTKGHRWLELKHIYVRAGSRGRGCGEALMAEAAKIMELEVCKCMQLSVFEMNAAAVRWYRRLGFKIVGLWHDYVGERSLCQAAVYLEMRFTPSAATTAKPRRPLPRSKAAGIADDLRAPARPPQLFGAELKDEVVTIDYPDNQGTFDVLVCDFRTKNDWGIHKVDSTGLSSWDGEEFVDEVDINLFFCNGLIAFKRPLSVQLSERELAKRAGRKRKRGKAAD